MDNERFDLIIGRYLRGKATAEEEATLLHAIRDSKEHFAYFREKTAAWDPSKEIGIDPDVDRQWQKIVSMITPTERPAVTTHRWSWKHLSVAAAIVLLLAFGITVYFLQGDGQALEYTTVLAEGGDQSITLPDGTSVYLREGSELIYPKEFALDVRRTEIKGEGFFDVERKEDHPFVVKAARVFVRVLGTSFSVHTEEEAVSVVLLNGKVSLADANEQEVTQLLPGQQVDYSLVDGHFTVTEVDGERATAWRRGVISYENASIDEIVHLIEETYHVSLTYTQGMNEQRFSGAFLKTQELKTVLEQTNKLTGMNLTLLNE